MSRRYLHIAFYWLFATVLMILGCSKVHFDDSTEVVGCQEMNQAYGANSCAGGPSGTYVYDYTVATGDVDILFVDDNSGSMYSEQTKMANQFPGFLDTIHKLSYQIAITSTDVMNAGPGQDGRFFSFPSGQTILSNSSRAKDSTHYSNISAFQNTIKRDETLDCPNGPKCPSGDERGIYAAIRALTRSENFDFFRPSGHLAIVVLSDEDERSTGGGAPGSSANGGAISPSYQFETEDLPETLVTTAKSILSPTKSFSVHSIIIRPGDTSCHGEQNSQGGGVKGYYGTQYALLSQPSNALLGLGLLREGTLGSICSSNYTVEMGQIAKHLTTSKVQLPCPALDGTLSVSYVDSVSSNQAYTTNSRQEIEFVPPLPAGTRIRLQFSCN